MDSIAEGNFKNFLKIALSDLDRLISYSYPSWKEFRQVGEMATLQSFYCEATNSAGQEQRLTQWKGCLDIGRM